MKILILSWRGPGHPNAGGAEITTHEHAKKWIEKGHDVELFTSFYDGAKSSEVTDKVKIVRKGNQILGVQMFAFFWLIFRQKKYDLIVDHFHGIPFFTPLYVRRKKVAFIHEIAKGVWGLNPWPVPISYIPMLLGPVVELIAVKYIYKKITFLTVSESTKSDLVSYGVDKKRIEVVHNGVTLALPERKPKKELIPTIIFLGAISKDKGVYDAIKVMKQILKIDDMWKMWIVGRGGDKEVGLMKQMIAKYKLEDNIKYFGFVSEDKKFDLLARAHILVNTSYHEGWSLVNIEANASGTPVVGYDVQGIKDSVKNNKNGILSKKGDYKQLAKNIISLIRNQNTYEQYCANAIKWAGKFNWEESSRKSLEIIESI